MLSELDASATAAEPTPSVSAEPVAWRDHVEQRIRSWRQRTMNKSGDRLAIDDFMGQESIDDLVDFVCDEFASPQPPVSGQPNARLVEALREAEEYIAQHSQANGYGLRDHDHDRYERLPLLERLSAALSAAEAAQKGTT